MLVDLTDSLDNAVSLGATLKNPVSHTARMVTPSLSRHAGVGVMRLDDYPYLDGRRLHNDGLQALPPLVTTSPGGDGSVAAILGSLLMASTG